MAIQIEEEFKLIHKRIDEMLLNMQERHKEIYSRLKEIENEVDKIPNQIVEEFDD